MTMVATAKIYKTDAKGRWMARYITNPFGNPVAWEASRSVVLLHSRDSKNLFSGREVIVETAHSIGHIDVADDWRLAPNGHRDVREDPMTRETIAAALSGKNLRGATAVVFFDSFHAEAKGSFNLVVAARTEDLLRAACSSLDQLCNYDLYNLSPKPGSSINAVSSYAPAKFLNIFTVAPQPSCRERNLVFVHLDNLAPSDGRTVAPELARMCLDVALAHMPEVLEDPAPVVRIQPYVRGCLLEKRMEHAIASADLTGVSTCVLYDPSPGGHHATAYESKPDQLWRVIVITKPQDGFTSSVLNLNVGGEMGSLVLNEDDKSYGAKTDALRTRPADELVGRPYYTSEDFRAHVKERPKTEDGAILFIPVPGLAYKQQWGPSNSSIEPEVVAKCVECLCAPTE